MKKPPSRRAVPKPSETTTTVPGDVDDAGTGLPDDAPSHDPWTDLSPDGEGLAVHDFLTTVFSHTSSELRRAITLPYAGRFGLNVSEWRVLSVLAHSGELPFASLVEQVVADKAQVSRTLQLLAGRGLVEVEALGAARRHGTTCRMTDAGRALYLQVMPEAQRSQAGMILTLTREERRVLFGVLKKLQAKCSTSSGGSSE